MGPCDGAGFPLVGLPAEVREIDRRAIADFGLPGRLLMELAGAGTASRILDRLPGRPGRAVVLCGPGGNGGDGYVVARHLAGAGWEVRCVSATDPETLQGDTATNHGLWCRLGGEVRVVKDRAPRAVQSWLNHAHVIVDGLLGTGQTRPLDGAFQSLVLAANASERGVRVALDVPTGVAGATGQTLGTPFQADLTVTYGISKPGLYQPPGASAAGEIVVQSVGWPRAAVDAVGASWRRITESAISPYLPTRAPEGHKGTFGHVGIVGGCEGMAGAASLASLAALRSGVGLVTCLHLSQERPPGLPAEVITESAVEGSAERIRALAVGPGLGQDDSAQDALTRFVKDPRPMVLDADALNLLSRNEAHPLGAMRVLTPHPLEAARLLGADVASIQEDRPGAARELASRWDCVVILKGAGSVVAQPEGPGYFLSVAEPALAVAGSGDVLAGLIAGLLAQGCSPLSSALAGVTVHALVGQRLGAPQGHQGVLASELADGIPEVMANLREC